MAQNTVLITGCSPGGIGDALARELHRSGWLVFATARNITKLADLEALGMETMQLDVASDDSIHAMASKLAAHPRIAERGLDMLINNAGIDHIMPFADFTLADIRRSLDTNLYGSLAVTNVLLRHVVRARGVVVLMGSITPHLPGTPFQTLYIATKAAIEAASHVMRVEMAPLGVRVVLLVPGSIKTRLMEDHVGGHTQAGHGGAGGSDGIAVPEGSWYTPIKEVIERRGFLDGITFTPVDVFARDVVGKLLRTQTPAQIWSGNLSSVVWWIKGLLWTGSMVCLTSTLRDF
jgi:1-acylglycerone phosphate reductase